MSEVATDRLSDLAMRYVVRPGAIAGFFVLVALLWTLPAQHTFAYPFLFLFFGAVMGSAWFGGILSGILAVLLSSLLIEYFFVPPFFSMTVARQSQSYFASFIFCAIAMALVSVAIRRSERAVRLARDQLEATVHERTAELLKSNQELLASGERLRTLTDAIPQQMWSADSAGRIEYCNHHLIDYIGGAVSGEIPSAFDRSLHPADRGIFLLACDAALKSNTAFEVEVRLQNNDGEYRWFLVRSIPQFSEDGTVACWYGVHIDVEQQYRAQQGMIQAQDELSQLTRTLSLGAMAASISHELNQPLTAVATQAYACREWLRSSPPNIERAASTAEKIVQESTRAGAVVARVRALFNKDEPIREFTNINLSILELVRLLRDDAIRRKITISVDLADDLPLIELDAIQIQQVLFNLAMNGMDAMIDTVEPRELTIRSIKHDICGVEIIVEDRGTGLTPEASTRMFDPFFTTKVHGTGMGLSICRSVIESHDGRIWATDLAGKGTRFHFTLRGQS